MLPWDTILYMILGGRGYTEACHDNSMVRLHLWKEAFAVHQIFLEALLTHDEVDLIVNTFMSEHATPGGLLTHFACEGCVCYKHFIFSQYSMSLSPFSFDVPMMYLPMQEVAFLPIFELKSHSMKSGLSISSNSL